MTAKLCEMSHHAVTLNGGDTNIRMLVFCTPLRRQVLARKGMNRSATCGGLCNGNLNSRTVLG